MIIGLTWARGSGSTLQSKNKYPILGRPLIYYPLMSLKKSGTVDHFYVFTEDDEIASVAAETGWKSIPREKRFLKYTDKNFSMNDAWKYITKHISDDLGIEYDKNAPSGYAAFQSLSETFFSLNCNNCMLRSQTFSRMLTLLREKKVMRVLPGVREDSNLMLGLENGGLYPLWYSSGLNRQEYPPLFKTLGNCFFNQRSNYREGGPNHYYVEIEEIEAFDVHSLYEVEFIEFYLTRHPDYFNQA